MDKVDIKDISGTLLLSASIGEGSKRKFLLMKEDYITLKFSLEEPVHFKLGDYVDDSRFGLFEVCDLQKPAYNTSTGGYDYDLRLDAYYWKWKNKIFKYTPEAAGREASWNLTAPLDVHAGVVLRNLKALGYTYKGQDFDFSIDSSVENKSLPMSYDNTNLIDALSKMAETWECEWWVIGHTIYFGRCEQGDPINFELGVNVEDMTRSDSQSTYATRIYAFGSTRNIPANYHPVDDNVVVNGVIQRRLMLPADTPFIDACEGLKTEEAVEQVVIFDDIYPRRIGSMSDVKANEETEVDEETGEKRKYKSYSFKDSGINFSEKYVLEGQELRIVFQSGKLNGLDFGVKFNPDNKAEMNEDGTWNSEAQLYKIVRNNDYGRYLPDNLLIPTNGDKYVLYGWNADKITELGLIAQAEQELKDKTQKYVDKSKIDPSTYTNKMMSDCMIDENGKAKLYNAGDRVNLINAAFFEAGSRQSRIIGFEYNLDIPYDSPVYTVGETAAYSRIGELESKVESITYKGFNYTYTTGSGSSSSDSSSTRLRKDIRVTAPKTGYFETGYVIMAGQTWEEILRRMLYEPAQATLQGSLSTPNDVEYGSEKGTLTYTAARNGQGNMKDAYYDNDAKNKLNFSTEVDGIQIARRQLSGVYTQGESYFATVIYSASPDGELPENILTNKISVNVRRKWFAGVCNAVPANSDQVRALTGNGLYSGAGTYKFNAGQWKMIAICIPEGTIKEITVTAYPGNFIEDTGVCSGPTTISVNGANNSAAITYKMWIIRAETMNDADTFTFKTN